MSSDLTPHPRRAAGPVPDSSPGAELELAGPRPKPDRKERISRARTAIASRFTRPGTHDFPLQTEQIAGSLQFTPAGVFAWYVLAPLNWEFMTLSERKGVWDAQRSRLGQLAESWEHGHRPFRIRRTTRPYAAYEWAVRFHALADPLPTVPGCESWADYLEHGQRRLLSTGLDQKMTAVGVLISPPAPKEAIEDLVHGSDHPRKEAVEIIEELLAVDDLMRGGGLNGSRATAGDMAFLMHRSLSMGLPAPTNAAVGGHRWTVDELGEFMDRREWIVEPFGQTIRVVGETDGQVVDRHVVTLTMGVMPDQTWPERGQDAWMMASDRLGFPVEWSLNGALIKGSDLEQTAVFELDKIRGNIEQYQDHRQTPRPADLRALEAATAALDEITEGTNRTAPRFQGTIRAAVYGETPDEAISRARKVALLYKDSLHMPLTRTLDQTRALREFVPGEPRVLKGWTRRFSVSYLAAAMPNIDAEVGTPEGPYLGFASLSRRAFLSDLHYGPEQLNMSGMMTASAAPGGGKSVLIGAYAYSAARAGEHTVILDPSGPLAALTKLPELAPFSRELNLTEADEGTLSPYRMIPTPQRINYDSDLEFDRAAKMAKAERSQLLFDVLRMELSNSTLALPGVDQLLQEAIRFMPSHRLAASGDPTQWNPRWVMEWLHAQQGSNEVAATVLRELEGAAEFPLGSLILPSHGGLIGDTGVDDATLVVITMPGLEPAPVDVAREHWGAAERYSQPLLHLAAFFAARFIYGRTRSERKNVFLDENHLMSRWGSGRAFNIRIARDSRKWNAGVISSSQHPDDHLAIGNLDALVGGCYVGKLPTESAARAGCRALGISEEYFPVLQTLESGEFVHRDQLRRVAKVKIDMKWHPSLQSLRTTPGHARAAFSGDLEPAPLLDPRLFTDATPRRAA